MVQNPEYNAREIAILRAFWNKERTVQEVADELDISYDVCVKVVRDLVRRGAILELPFRQNRQRRLTAIEIPGLSNLPPVEQIVMPWGSKLQSIPQVILSFSPTKEASVRARVLSLLAALEFIGEQHADGNEAGWTAKDVRIAMRKTVSDLNTWRTFLEGLLQLPIWFNDPKAVTKIGMGFDDEQRMQLALEMEQHFMTSGKRALEE